MATFGYTICYVDDVDRTLEFYKSAFGFETKFRHPAAPYGELETGATVLAFAGHDLAETNFDGGYIRHDRDAKPQAVEIAIVTDDVDAAIEAATSVGATLLRDATTKPWGQIVGYVRDPNGVLIEICTAMS